MDAARPAAALQHQAAWNPASTRGWAHLPPAQLSLSFHTIHYFAPHPPTPPSSAPTFLPLFAGTYVVVKDLPEAEYVCSYILNGGDRAEFLAKFENATSPGFDPETDLERVGVANQTTMLKGETEAIGKLLERTILTKYGPAKLNDYFMVMDTICDATQERQDAVYDMTGKQVRPHGRSARAGGKDGWNVRVERTGTRRLGQQGGQQRAVWQDGRRWQGAWARGRAPGGREAN